MKKKLLPIFYKGIAVFSMLVLVIGLSQQEALAQCTNVSSYGSATAPTSGSTTISTCSYLEEYSTLNSVAANTVYSCAIASGGYVTIHQGSPAGPVIGYGPSPLTWTSTVSGTYYSHWTVDATCATSTGCVTTSISFIATLPATPPTPTQDPAAPTCTGGSALSVTGTPGTDEAWYWQTTPTGTSMATPYSGPYTVFANGTYYLRAYNTVNTYWSATSSSIVVSNFPTATTPAAPTAGQNPACNSTTLTAGTPPVGTTYYWQTVANGSSNASDASTPLTVSTTGTYYLAAYDNASQCWSATSSTMVTIQTIVPPAPLANPTYYNYCSTEPSMPVSAQLPPPTTNTGSCSATATASGDDGSSVTATVNDFSCAPTTIVSASMNASIGQYCALYGWYSYDVIVNGTTILTGLCDQNNIDLTPYLPLTSVSIVSNDDDGYPFDFVNMSLTVNVSYITDPYTISWFSAPTGGSAIGTGTSIEALGTSVLPTAVTGSYDFYAANNQGACASATRTLVTVNVTDVLATLTPVNILCNGMNDGSFTLGTVSCGTAPFTYSVDGGAFLPIPNNLTPGVHSIVMKDANNLNSAPISITITEPSAPTGLNAFNVTFFNGMLTWSPQGNETTWNVEYGPAGFTPGTGIMMAGVTNDTIPVSGLTEDTDYDFYVQAGCTASSAWAGPFSFSTDVPFSTWDSQCGPGFTAIHTTGTALNLADDASIGITTVNPVSFQGVTSNNITVSNNGWVSFGAVNMNVWNVDLDDEEGNVYWQETTIGGDNYLIIEWYNRPKFSTVSGQNVTFEVAFNQTTGETFYLYDDKVFGGSQSAYDYAGNFATISAAGPMSTITVSYNSQTYLQNNSCVRLYTSLCPNVQNMVTITYTDDAQLNWDPGMYGETNWTVIYGLDGFDPTVPGQAIDTLTVNTSEVNFGGTLTQLTCYDAYIYSECQADNLTSDGFLVNFCTKPNCADITSLAGTTDPDSLELTWNWTASSMVYPVTGFNIQYGMTGFTLGNGTITPASGIDFADTVFNATLMGSGVYQVYVQAECSGTTDTSNWVGPISLVMPVTNDIVCSQEALQLNSIYTFNNNGATVSLNETNIAPPATGAQTTTGWVNSTLNGTLWYTFVAPPSGSVRVNSNAISYNGQAAVYSAVNCADFNTFTLLAANDDEIGGTSLAPNFTVCGLTPGTTYYIMYDKFNGTSGNFSLKVTEIVLEGGNALPLTEICYGTNLDLFTTITGNNTGGTWSSAIPSVNASITGSDFESNGLAYTTFDFEYRVVDGCAYDSIISQVKVYAPSNAGQDGSITACKNEPIDLLAGLNGNADLNGNWFDPSDSPIPNSQVTTANFPGQYNYDYISGNGVCPDDTANVVVTVGTCDFLSVEENALEGVSLYPNPSTGVVFIESTFTGNFDLVVTDINGRTIQTGTGITSGTNTVNLKEVERGTYFFKLSTENAEKVFRVVIQ
ncbi:T9SS type A sorting domain-containing protein [Fluviicola chungangensis]|uniref:T9SS type A sorting domain-containing protein n=1 Tax=Fluviicola chungangensis TaxID=2597671 RepID=A0A556N039_9FLAO|nr:T9SS type A sorting domain-containing protein [Fluviicola chungangensis]TSJ45550.1 T9SS type A sorting domain-containing protein [Fluviicola chungangensis]